MKLLLRVGAWLSIVLIAGCAGNDVRSLANQPAVTPFDLSGRMVVRGRDEPGFSGALRWECHAQSDEIWLSTPLGQSIAHLQADADGATLTAADGTQYRATSVERLTQIALGWRFPFAPLRYWVRGVGAPDMAEGQIERDHADRLIRFTQGEWRVEFSYAQDIATMPSRLNVVSGDVVIRLVIDRLESLSP